MTLDPLLAAFAPVVGVVLAGAAALIGGASLVLRDRQPALVRELWLRYASWIVMAAVVLGALALGRSAWIALVALMSVAAFREYARAAGFGQAPHFRKLAYALVVLVHVAAWWPYPGGSSEPGWYSLFMTAPVYATMAILTLPTLRDEFAYALREMSLSILGVVYFGWFLGHLAYLVNLPNGVGLVLFLSFLVALNDVAAFVLGKLTGRHKLRPTLSPGKTWEGAVGAVLVVLPTAWTLRWLVPGFRPIHLLVAAGVVSVGATLGDLALSAIKRDLGIKDWGDTIPGHGGLLDRLNSILFAAPLLFHATRYWLA